MRDKTIEHQQKVGEFVECDDENARPHRKMVLE
jgi:hypothetical protein